MDETRPCNVGEPYPPGTTARRFVTDTLTALGRRLSARPQRRNRSLGASRLSLLAPRWRGGPRNARAKDLILAPRLAQLVDFGAARRASSRAWVAGWQRRREGDARRGRAPARCDIGRGDGVSDDTMTQSPYGGQRWVRTCLDSSREAHRGRRGRRRAPVAAGARCDIGRGDGLSDAPMSHPCACVPPGGCARESLTWASPRSSAC